MVFNNHGRAIRKKRCLQIECVSYFFHCCAKVLEKQLKGENSLGSQFACIIVKKSWQQKPEMTGHITFTQETEAKECP